MRPVVPMMILPTAFTREGEWRIDSRACWLFIRIGRGEGFIEVLVVGLKEREGFKKEIPGEVKNIQQS